MAYQALYRKYRSHNFNDFVDQDVIKKVLINSLKNNKVSHAYLFSGPRGVGKTSLAKIFAKAVNCLNFNENDDVCEKCTNCLECNEKAVDIIEIDAASNNGVDQIRDLRSKVNIVPTSLKYKVYIVDEVHMLTNSAFNALLKTLEEPPSHVIFILATTEFYEVPETIVSRCQCFSFNRISLDGIQNRLKFIAEKENINIDNETIKEIAHYSNGGLRDAIGMLDKLNSFTDLKIDIESFKLINGLISHEDIEKFYNSVFQQNYGEILQLINKIENSGYDFKNFIERLMSYTRDIVVDYYINNKTTLYDLNSNINFITKLNEILNCLKDSLNPLIIVQIYIFKFMSDLHKNVNKIISREIILKENLQKTEKNNEIISQEIISKTIHNQNNDLEHNKIFVNDNIKKIRINNALATADIQLKKNISKKWESLNQYFLDEVYGKIAQILCDTIPTIVGKNNLVLVCETDGIINKIYTNIDCIEKFVTDLCEGIEQKIVVLKSDEFSTIKNKYVEDIKKGVTYKITEETEQFVTKKSNDLISKAINVFGKDILEIEEEK